MLVMPASRRSRHVRSPVRSHSASQDEATAHQVVPKVMSITPSGKGLRAAPGTLRPIST